MRGIFTVFAALLILVSISALPTVASAQSSSYQFNILLLIDDSYLVYEGDECRIDNDRQSRILLKVNNEDGRRSGGVWFLRGQPIQMSVGTGGEETYCAYAKTVDVEEPGQMDLLLHNEYLLTLDPQTISGDEMLQLVVGTNGLVNEQVVEYDAVAELGIEMPRRLATEVTRTSRSDSRTSLADTQSDDSETVTRTTRTSSSNTSETPTPSRTSSGNISETSQQSGIITGEWEMEGDSAWDVLFVTIDEDTSGYGLEFLHEIDPQEMAVEFGAPLIGEGRAPEGCRIFAFSGPLGVALYVAYCADGDHLLYAGGTDKDVIDGVVEDFIFDRPFRIPRGYTEVY